jgi:hypothetical protein
VTQGVPNNLPLSPFSGLGVSRQGIYSPAAPALKLQTTRAPHYSLAAPALNSLFSALIYQAAFFPAVTST